MAQQPSPLEGLVPLDREVVETLTTAICATFPRWDRHRAGERARAFCDAVWAKPDSLRRTCLQNLAINVQQRNRILVSQTTRKVCGEVLEYARTGHVNYPDECLDSSKETTA